MCGKINIYISLLRAYVVRGVDVVINIARFCRRVFVVRAFVSARFCLRAFVLRAFVTAPPSLVNWFDCFLVQ